MRELAELELDREEEILAPLSDKVIMSLNTICAATGRSLTAEQMLFASDFTTPTISFSDAGTGKTAALAVGLVHAQTYHEVAGRSICVMSFTKEAAREISERYDLMRSYKFIRDPAAFSTFHSLCNSIITDAWGRPNIRDFDYFNDLPVLRKLVEDQGLTNIRDQWLKSLLMAMNSLNSAFVFDEEEMITMSKFKELDISPVIFNSIRKEWFLRQAALRTLPKGDLPIHCYNLIMRNPVIRKKYYKKFKILVIDEFQDMSLLYMKIIIQLCHTPVVIGDMKQQIYAFNGASDDIEKEFFNAYPDARVCPLTQSFRCKDEIVDYAMKLIEPNNPKSYGFKGIGKGGQVKVIRNRELSLDEIADEIYHYQMNVETVKKKDIMFLFRNNFSGMVVMDKFYRHGVRFRTGNFKKIMDLPIFSEICTLLDSAEDPTNVDKAWEALKLFDECRYTRREQCPILSIMTSKNVSWLDINYSWKNTEMYEIVKVIKICKDAIEKDTKAGQIFMTLLPIYEQFILKGKWFMLPMSKEFYFNLVGPIANDKPYRKLRAEEFDKENKNNEALVHYDGVRCYTIHSAKGLEAEEVYIIDCEQGIIPSDKNLKKFKKADSLYEAARSVRNERNLMYVACTRAKNKLFICYTSELAHLIERPKENEYSYLDEVYNATPRNFHNVEAFMALFNYKLGEGDA